MYLRTAKKQRQLIYLALSLGLPCHLHHFVFPFCILYFLLSGEAFPPWPKAATPALRVNNSASTDDKHHSLELPKPKIPGKEPDPALLFDPPQAAVQCSKVRNDLWIKCFLVQWVCLEVWGHLVQILGVTHQHRSYKWGEVPKVTRPSLKCGMPPS